MNLSHSHLKPSRLVAIDIPFSNEFHKLIYRVFTECTITEFTKTLFLAVLNPLSLDDAVIPVPEEGKLIS